jgi:anti-sigma factor (TIGR02949 family)
LEQVMKNCAEIDPLMTPFVDGETDPETRRAVETHLSDCPPCRERAEIEQMARRLMREGAATLAGPAPVGLRARCLAAVPAAVAPVVSSGRRSFGVRRWLPLSMAATLLLAVTGVFIAGQQERLQAAFAAQLAIDHQKCFHEFGTGHPQIDEIQAEAKLAAEHGLEVDVPGSAAADQIELVDVRSCDYDRGHMAHLLYEVEGRPVSLYVIPETRQSERSLEVMDHQARLWSSNEAAYVLVGQERADDMDKVVAYMRGYGR